MWLANIVFDWHTDRHTIQKKQKVPLAFGDTPRCSPLKNHLDRRAHLCLGGYFFIFERYAYKTVWRITFYSDTSTSPSLRVQRSNPEYQSSFDKSRHSGLSFSIRSNFFFREPPLISFSRERAVYMSSYNSSYNS